MAPKPVFGKPVHSSNTQLIPDPEIQLLFVLSYGSLDDMSREKDWIRRGLPWMSCQRGHYSRSTEVGEGGSCLSARPWRESLCKATPRYLCAEQSSLDVEPVGCLRMSLHCTLRHDSTMCEFVALYSSVEPDSETSPHCLSKRSPPLRLSGVVNGLSENDRYLRFKTFRGN